MNLLIKGVILVAAVFITAWLLPGVAFETFEAGILVALLLAFVNTFIKPIMRLLFFPINLLSLGTFPLVMNTVFVLIIHYFIKDFRIFAQTYLMAFGWAFAFGLIVSIVAVILENVLNVD
jgi:putative membrane protein